MHNLKIAANPRVTGAFRASREVVDLAGSDLTDVGAVVLTIEDLTNGTYERVANTGFGIPVFVVSTGHGQISVEMLGNLAGVFNSDRANADLYGDRIDATAASYEARLLPPFFDSLVNYVQRDNAQFDCPGHQGGAFFRKHPAGRAFADFFGENIFYADLCNADVPLGDLLIHEGAPAEAQRHAARVFNADKTYFILNGTSASNKVVLNAVLTPGDLVLFDRNNHKSAHHGALLQAGATPVYMETSRNPYGFIGGIDNRCYDEKTLRERVREIAPERADAPRPFRMAVVQLGTYDGTIGNARQIVDRIGALCDYILFDSAWVGYEQFIPMMRECSPLLLELGPEDPGIFVTQSVHKQLAGFSQASQIHKKDSHIRGQARYVPHKRVNNSFLMHASTSPFYPLFASLDVNAKIHDGEVGQRLWNECVLLGIQTRKEIFRRCRHIRPFVPDKVGGVAWQDIPAEELASSLRHFEYKPKARWHGFKGYAPHQYYVDPCKLLLTTPGIDPESGEYEEFGVPAKILASYLRENTVVPEKCDLNSILFLLTPAEDPAKMDRLVDELVRFERLLDENAPLSVVLPELTRSHRGRYAGYRLRELCQEMHAFDRAHRVKDLQRAMFLREGLPRVAMRPLDAHREFVRGHVDLIPLSQARGRIAAEGALPYPPGILCCVPGEVWDGPVLEYFLAIEEAINAQPGFSPEVQGVYVERQPDGGSRILCHVIRQE